MKDERRLVSDDAMSPASRLVTMSAKAQLQRRKYLNTAATNHDKTLSIH